MDLLFKSHVYFTLVKTWRPNFNFYTTDKLQNYTSVSTAIFTNSRPAAKTVLLCAGSVNLAIYIIYRFQFAIRFSLLKSNW